MFNIFLLLFRSVKCNFYSFFFRFYFSNSIDFFFFEFNKFVPQKNNLFTYTLTVIYLFFLNKKFFYLLFLFFVFSKIFFSESQLNTSTVNTGKQAYTTHLEFS